MRSIQFVFFNFKYRLAISPKDSNNAQYSLDSTLKKFYSGQLNRFKLNKTTNSLLAPLNEDLNKKLLKEIESIKPDHEQRKLAIEVNYFNFNCLLN